MELVNRFLSFDKLMGSALVKFVYYVGLIGLAIMTLVGMFSGFSQGFGAGVGSMIIAPIVGLFGLLFWRFMCELYLAIFKISNDLSEIRRATVSSGVGTFGGASASSDAEKNTTEAPKPTKSETESDEKPES